MKAGKVEFMVKTFRSPGNVENQYLLIQGAEAAVVDAGEGIEDIRRVLREGGITLRYLLLTHGHKAHPPVLSALKREFGGSFCMHREDLDLLPDSDEKIEPDILVKDRERLTLGALEITVLHTPGHTLGGLCFYLPPVHALFSGNTLLKGEYGKIHGPNGMRLMMMSLRRLYNIMPPETVVYPALGPTTTIRGEAWMFCLNSM